MKKILTFIFLGFAFQAFAQSSGGLDTDFSTDGKHTIDINGNETSKAVTIFEGKIITAGTNASQVMVTRQLATGQPDLTFSIDGEAFTSIPNGSTIEVGDVAVQSDGKIVVVGTVRDLSNFSVNLWDFFIVRFLPTGNLDTSFDGDGILKQNLNSYDKYNAVKIQPDGNIVLAGISNGVFLAQRRLPSGVLDLSFGNSGTAAIIAGEAQSMEISSNGKITIAGSVQNGGPSSNFVVARLNSNGTPDLSFDFDGKLVTDISGSDSDDFVHDLSIDSEGRIVVVGETFVTGLGKEIAIVRYLPNGALDTDFGGTGKKVFSVSANNEYGRSVEVLPDNQIVIAGTTVTSAYSYTQILPGGISLVINVPANDDMMVMLVNTSGELNTTFSGDGIQKVAFEEGKNDKAFGMALQLDGKIVVVGSAINGTNTDFAYFRMHTIYGFDHLENTLYASNGPNLISGKSISVDQEGNLFVASDIFNGTDFSWEIRKYKDTGLLDNTFSGDGKVTFSTSFLPPQAKVSKIFVQADGKILVAGSSVLGGAAVFTVIRLLSNGSLDISFDGDGKQQIYLGSSGSYCTGLKTMIGGKIVLSGNSYTTNNSFVSLVRLNSDGSFDTTFGSNGAVSINVSPIFRNAKDLDILGDKIFVGGEIISPAGFFAMKFNNDGSLDNSFDGDGFVHYSIGTPQNSCSSIKVQADGKVLLGGNIYNSPSIIRLNTNGALDNSFANNGVFNYTSQTLDPGEITSMLINNDGSILAGGNVLNRDLLFKLKSDGSFFPQFADKGKFLFNPTSYIYTTLNQIASGSSERFYTVGYYNNGSNVNLQIRVFTQCKYEKILLTHPQDDINSVVTAPYLAQKIEASNYILSGGNAKYEAVREVLLKPGFKADASSVFSAQIKPTCSYSTPPLVIGGN